MKVFTFSQQGKRSNNEDYFGYNEWLWMVCDGVGGHVSGERASRFVVEKMIEYFRQEVPELNKNKIQDALDKVQVSLNQVLNSEPELEKMGTTFTGIFKTDTYWYAAHIGDSRIYLFRPSEKKLWHTWDHSLVGEMMRHHDITREEGRFHPMSNRISKAIIANTEGKINTASIATIDELKPGDLFLLCSDGVVEAWGDHELTRLFSDPNLTFEQMGEKLREQCGRLSKDNNTALLLRVEAEDAFSFGHNEELSWVSFQEIDDDYQVYQNKVKAEQEEDSDNVVVDLNNLPAKDGYASDVTPVQKNAPVTKPTSPFPTSSPYLAPKVPTSAPDDKNTIKRLKTALFLLLAVIVVAGSFVLVRHFTGNRIQKARTENGVQVVDTQKVTSEKNDRIQSSDFPKNENNGQKQYLKSFRKGLSYYNQGKYREAFSCFLDAKKNAGTSDDKKEVDEWIGKCEAKLAQEQKDPVENNETDDKTTSEIDNDSRDKENRVDYAIINLQKQTDSIKK